jgi:hypothetical protein
MSFLLVNILSGFLGECRGHNEDTGQIRFDCPACSAENGLIDGDGKGNLEINYDRSVFKCWSCKDRNYMSGSVLKLLNNYATPKNIRDYLLVRPDADVITEKERVEIVVTLPKGYKKLTDCTYKDFKYNIAMGYLRSRGITDDIIKEFEIGYTTEGDFFNRIIIPSYDSEGKLNYFIARWFAKEYTKLKYINPIAEKQEIVFGESKVNWDATIYLVEGATDFIVTPNSIPLLGKFISEILFELLYTKASGNIVIVLDGEDEAYADALNIYHQLNFGDLRGRIRIVRPPENEDPSTIFQKYGFKGIISLLRTAIKLPEY